MNSCWQKASYIFAAAALVAGCGSGGGTSTPTPSPTPSAAPSPTPLPDLTRFVAADIGNPGMGNRYVYLFGPAAMNDAGQVASTWSVGSVIPHAYFYTPGDGFRALDIPGKSSYAKGINNSGSVICDSVDSNDVHHAYLYEGGTLHDIGATLPNPSADNQAAAINDRGQIVVNGLNASGLNHAFLYENGVSRDLGDLDGDTSDSIGDAINASGQVVGDSSSKRFAEPHAFLYSDGAMQDLVEANPYWGLSVALAINDNGQIVGAGIAPDGQYHAAVYSSGQFQDLNVLASRSGSGNLVLSRANSINNSGAVVGDIARGSMIGGVFLYANGTVRNLNDITSGTSGITLGAAYSITDSGQILAEGIGNDSSYHLYILTPASAETRTKHPTRIGR